MIWKLNHEVGTDQTLASEPRAVPAFAQPAPRHSRWPWAALTDDAHIGTTCGWSVSLTRFDVAKLRAAAKAMLKQYDCALLKWLLGVALQGASGPAPKTNYDSSRYSAEDHYMIHIIARPLAVIGD